MKFKILLYAFSLVFSMNCASARFTPLQEESRVKFFHHVRNHLPFREREQSVNAPSKENISEYGRDLKRTKAYYEPVINSNELKIRKGGAVSPRVNDRQCITTMRWEEQHLASVEELVFQIYWGFTDKNLSEFYPLMARHTKHLSVLGVGCNLLLGNIYQQILIDKRHEDGYRHIHSPIPDFAMIEETSIN